MSAPKRADVIVVGAGPVGMFTALCLRKQKIEVEIFDSGPRSSTHSYALALHPDSLSLLDKLGVLQHLQGRMFPLRKIAIFQERDEVATIDLTSITGLEHPFLAVVSQSDLEAALVESLREQGVTVRWSHRISELEDTGRKVRAVVAELEERPLGYAVGHVEQFVRKSHDLEAALVVGADGHDSFVRRSLDVRFPVVGPAETFAVFEFKGEGVDDDTMQIFASARQEISVRWPLGRDTWRWSFGVGEDFRLTEGLREKDPDVVQFVNTVPYSLLDRDDLQGLIRERAPWCSSAAENIYWRLLVRFEKRLADSFGKGRIWLAGDAAHLTSPIGVQSMNVGLREAHDLAERMVAVIDARASGAVFEEYNRERLEEWRFLSGLAGKLRPGAGIDPRLASLAPVIHSWLPASGYALATLADRLGFKTEGMPVGSGRLGDAAQASTGT